MTKVTVRRRRRVHGPPVAPHDRHDPPEWPWAPVRWFGMLSGMTAPTEPPDQAEPDLYWSGHSGWAMLPGLVVGVVLSGVVMLGLTGVGELVNMKVETTAFIRF